MKKILISTFAILVLAAMPTIAQDQPEAKPDAQAAERRAASDASQDAKTAAWVGGLALDDPEKEARLIEAVATHLKAVRDWHDSHPYTLVPPGICPRTGNPLSQLDRQFIINSTIPASVGDDLMAALRKDLTEEQLEAILDRYTVGKVDFTMRGYEAIVPDLTDSERAFILETLKEARERAVNYKNMNHISLMFNIYKQQCEEHLYRNGRNWRLLFQAFVAERDAEKAEEAFKKALEEARTGTEEAKENVATAEDLLDAAREKARRLRQAATDASLPPGSMEN